MATFVILKIKLKTKLKVMKKFVLILLLATLVFSSCSKKKTCTEIADKLDRITMEYEQDNPGWVSGITRVGDVYGYGSDQYNDYVMRYNRWLDGIEDKTFEYTNEWKDAECPN